MAYVCASSDVSIDLFRVQQGFVERAAVIGEI
jgi:hypothetical protein